MASSLALSFTWRVTIQIILERLWVLQNAIYALLGLSDMVPASVDFYLAAYIDVVNTDTFFSDELSAWLFDDFSDTDPYNAQLEQLDMESSNSILNAGFIFYLVCIYILVTIAGMLFFALAST